MPAFIAAWTGVVALLFAIVNLALVPFEWRLLVMQVWGIVDALPLTFGIMVLWSFRKAGNGDPAVGAQRMQAKVGIGLALAALALNCAYLLWYYETWVRPQQ